MNGPIIKDGKRIGYASQISGYIHYNGKTILTWESLLKIGEESRCLFASGTEKRD